ncbi:MAG: polysaccharide biosynthesis protein, partial [Syntrophales bacterium]
MLLFDITLAACAYGFSYLIRFEGAIPTGHLSTLKNTIVWVVAVKVMFFIYFNLYRGMWRYTSLVDFMNVIKAVTASSISIILIIVFFYGFPGFSRSVFILDFLLTVAFVAGIRVGIRIYLSRKQTAFLPIFGKKTRK